MENPFKKFFLRQDLSNDQAGMCWDNDGIAIVQLTDVESDKARLETCLWHPWSEEEKPASPPELSLEVVSEQDHHQQIRLLAENHNLLKVPFNCCLRIEDYDLFPNDAADVAPTELASAMKWIIRDRLDFGLEDAVVDCFYIPDPIRMAPERKVYVIAAHKNVVSRYLDNCRRARLNMRAVEVVELALNNVAGHLPEIDRGLALLYYPPSGETGCLIVAKEDKLYLARRIGAISKEAQDMGLDPTEGIAAEIQRSLDYVEADFTNSPISVLYIAAMPDMEETLRDGVGMRLNIRVKMLRALSLFENSLELDQATVHRCLPALGEALRPLDEKEA